MKHAKRRSPSMAVAGLGALGLVAGACAVDPSSSTSVAANPDASLPEETARETLALAPPVVTRLVDPAATPRDPRPFSPSPPLTAGFDALDDNGAVAPPNADGAVGPTQLMVVLNSQMRVQDKAGSTLSTTTLAGFFSSLGHTGSITAPKVIYDSLAGRWIITAIADPATSTAAVVLAVSQSTDATGSFSFYNVPVTGTNYADAPKVGFNKDWIVVTSNLYANASSAWQGCHVDVFSKANAYSGTLGAFTRFTTTAASGDFGMQPALEYDGTLATLYLLEEWSGVSAQERLKTITGAVGSEALSAGTLVTMPQGAWAEKAATTNFAPQLGSTNKIDTFDASMQSVVYRNGQLWGTHTIFLPAVATPTRSSVQWFNINPTNGTVNQSGRIDDAAGTSFYAFPSLAVNRYNDALLGYSRFSPTQYASANYAVRFNFDATSTWGDDTVYKAGLASYFKDFGSGDNQWGHYSMTSVDPSDDTTLWTIQEYAASPANQWGTWWGKLTIDCAGKADGTECDSDGHCSSGPKTCQSGACVGTSPVVCAPLDQCHAPGTCDPTTGVCSNPLQPDGTTCSLGQCVVGACTPIASDAGADGGSATDGGASDAGSTDAGSTDAAAGDSGASDGGTTDGGTSDGGTMDAATTDSGASDGGSTADAATSSDASSNDGAVNTTDAGPTADSGEALDASGDGGAGDSGGCGCRVAESKRTPSSTLFAFGAFGALALYRLRRRRDRART